MIEEWRPAKGFEGYYEASSFGSIRRKGCEHALKGYINNGRRMVCLSVNGKSKTYKLHRIIAKTFIPNPDNKPEVNHINGDPLNNCIWNLEWATRSENQLHAYAHGLAGYSTARRKKISERQRDRMKPVIRSDGKIFESIGAAARSVGCNSGSISSVLHGLRPSAKGFSFAFLDEKGA